MNHIVGCTRGPFFSFFSFLFFLYITTLSLSTFLFLFYYYYHYSLFSYSSLSFRFLFPLFFSLHPSADHLMDKSIRTPLRSHPLTIPFYSGRFDTPLRLSRFLHDAGVTACTHNRQHRCRNRSSTPACHCVYTALTLKTMRKSSYPSSSSSSSSFLVCLLSVFLFCIPFILPFLFSGAGDIYIYIRLIQSTRWYTQ